MNTFIIQFLGSRNRIVVSTLRCGRSNPGSNPGYGRTIFFRCSKAWKVVSINGYAGGWGSYHMWLKLSSFWPQIIIVLYWSDVQCQFMFLKSLILSYSCINNELAFLRNMWFDIHNMVDYCIVISLTVNFGLLHRYF